MRPSSSLVWTVLAIGAAGLFLTLTFSRPASRSRLPGDGVRVVSVGAPTVKTVLSEPSGNHVAPSAAASDWTGPERDAVLRSLALPAAARIRDVLDADPRRQEICGEVQAGPNQPFRRFVYLKAAKLGALADGGSEFERTYSQLCGQSAPTN